MVNTFFTDISSIGKIRLSGQSASSFIQTMTTVKASLIAAVGQVAPALLLTSEAEIIDIIMIARTGPEEFMLSTHPGTAAEVLEWLKAHSQISDDQGPVFANLELSDQTKALASLAIYGDQALTILDQISNDHVQTSLPSAGLTITKIGQLSVMLLRWSFLNNDVFEIHLPAVASQQLQNLLLSFVEIDPKPIEKYRELRKAAKTWFSGAEQAKYFKPNTPGLLALLRDSRDFVGARALNQAAKSRTC